jgi:pyruvate formate lyase activating enzyme
MNIRGIYKTSLIDFPGRICAVLFAGGCNLRCRYCHNRDLALNSDRLRSESDEDILNFLKRRKGLIDGVVISGGEPTLDRDLEAFLEKVKALDLEVKLDTNGLNPPVVGNLLAKGLLDYTALDIKTSPEKYPGLAGRPVDFNLILETLSLLREFPAEYEVRTTCVPGFVTMDDLEKIIASTGPVKKYCLQQFVPSADLIDPELASVQPYPVKVLKSFAEFMGERSGICEIRGI